MANQILAGAVFQASMVIAGVDADNPPYVGPPPRIVAMRQFIYQTDPGDSTVYTMAMDGTDLQTLPFPDGLVQNKNGNYARNIASDANKVVVSDEDNGRVFVYDMATGAAPTSFAVAELDNRVNSMMLSGTRLFTHDSGSSGVHIYDITTGEKVGNYSNSDGTGFLRSTVSGGKFIGIPYDPTNSNQRSMYIYEVGDNDGSSEIKVDLPDLTNPYQQHNVSLAAGEGKIVYGTESTDATFYIWDIDGTNRIDVDTSSFVPGGYWGSSMTMAGRRVGHWASAIGDGKIVINSDFPGMLFVCNLDGSDLNTIDLYNITPSSEHYKFNGMASTNDGYLAIADGKVIAPALNGKTDTSDNESEGIIWILDLHQRTVLAQIESPVLDESVRFGRDFGVYTTVAPATESAPTPSLGDPFPHAGDMKATGAPSPFYAHSEEVNDWLTYGVTANETYGTSGGRPRMTDEAAGAIHFIRYDLDNEILYGYMSYATSEGPGAVLDDIGWGGMGHFWSFWTNFGNNTHAAPIGSYFPIGIKRPMTEAEFDALELYWDADGGQSGQGSWRINPDVEVPTMPTPATSVTDASFTAEASDGLAVVHNSRFDVFANWISYGTVGFHGEHGGKDRIVAEGTATGAVHYLRYDPIGKRIWSLVSWHPQGGGVGPTLIEKGFGDLTTDFSTEPFFSAYLYNNFTYTASIGSYFPAIVGSRLTYEPEDLAGLGITWDGTTWSKS